MSSSGPMDDAMFDPDRPWLENQPGMNPWAEGCASLAVDLKAWAETYRRTVGAPTDTHSDAKPYIERLWRCWAYHWQDAASLQPTGTIRGIQVAQRIRSGRGYKKGCQLGGDPLRDVVLAEAAGQQQPRAVEILEQEYKEWAVAQAAKVNPEVAGEPEDFWCRLLDKLVGYSDPPGKLAKFHGRCGLRNWLATVAKNMAREDRRPDPPEADDIDPDAEPCLRLLALFVQPSLRKLAGDQQVLLYWLFVEERKGNEVAKILGLHPGQITRQKQRALEVWQEAMLRAAGEVAQESEYLRCLLLLLRQRNLRDFAGFFFSELSDAAQEARRDSNDSQERKSDHEQ